MVYEFGGRCWPRKRRCIARPNHNAGKWFGFQSCDVSGISRPSRGDIIDPALLRLGVSRGGVDGRRPRSPGSAIRRRRPCIPAVQLEVGVVIPGTRRRRRPRLNRPSPESAPRRRRNPARGPASPLPYRVLMRPLRHCSGELPAHLRYAARQDADRELQDGRHRSLERHHPGARPRPGCVTQPDQTDTRLMRHRARRSPQGCACRAAARGHGPPAAMSKSATLRRCERPAITTARPSGHSS